MAIEVWGYLREFEEEREDIFQAIEQVMTSGRLVLGESVRRFESEFASYCGVRYGVGVANGTNAISLGLRAIGVEPGDEVITVSNTAAPTVVLVYWLDMHGHQAILVFVAKRPGRSAWTCHSG